MRKLIIHAGFPKSGTTALQAAFRENSQLLLDHGIHYPESVNDAHHTGIASLVGRSVGWTPIKRSEEMWDYFAKQIVESKFNTILISSEFFSSARPESIMKIRNDFSDFDVEIIFTLRSLDSIIPSIYQQNLKKGAVATYPQWISKKFLTVDGNLLSKPRLINHSEIINAWVNEFGADKVSLVMADTSQPEMLYRHIEKILGIGNLNPVATRALNRSLTIRECEILRLINQATVGNWSWYEYRKIIRQGWVKELSGTPASGNYVKYSTPDFLKGTVSDYANGQIDRIQKSGIRVFGNLDIFASTQDSPRELSGNELKLAQLEFDLVWKKLRRIYQAEKIRPANIIKRIRLKFK